MQGLTITAGDELLDETTLPLLELYPLLELDTITLELENSLLLENSVTVALEL
jgi:hypothetical protein